MSILALTYDMDDAGGMLRVSGVVDLEGADRLVDVAAVMSPIRLDLSGVGFMDSMGLSALIRLRNLAGGRLEIVAVSRQVHNVIVRAGLEGVLPVAH
jgi:anti-anti-sigma factor